MHQRDHPQNWAQDGDQKHHVWGEFLGVKGVMVIDDGDVLKGNGRGRVLVQRLNRGNKRG